MTTTIAPRPIAKKQSHYADTPEEIIRIACAAVGIEFHEAFPFSTDPERLWRKEHQRRRIVLGAAIRIANYASKPLTAPAIAQATGMALSSVYNMLNEVPDPGVPKHTFAEVMKAVCNEMGITSPDLGGRSRHPTQVWARRITVIISRELTLMSFPDMAKRMGLPNHSTLCTSRKQGMTRLALPHGHPLRMVKPHGSENPGRDAQDIIDRVKGRLGIGGDANA